MKLKQVAIAIDQLFNTLFGGWADECISSRLYRTNSRGMKYVDMLFFWQEDHCYKSYMQEKEQKQQPPELRGSP